jgi:CheY-like chemotaxis protein
MTANAMEGDRDRCLLAGMDDYVAKPVTAASLAEVLERWTAKDPDARGASGTSSDTSRNAR